MGVGWELCVHYQAPCQPLLSSGKEEVSDMKRCIREGSEGGTKREGLIGSRGWMGGWQLMHAT